MLAAPLRRTRTVFVFFSVDCEGSLFFFLCLSSILWCAIDFIHSFELCVCVCVCVFFFFFFFVLPGLFFSLIFLHYETNICTKKKEKRRGLFFFVVKRAFTWK